MEILSLPEIIHNSKTHNTSFSSSTLSTSNRHSRRRSFLQVTKKEETTLRRRPSVRLTILDNQLLENQILKVPIRIKSRTQSTRASQKPPNLYHFNVENCNDYLVQFQREKMGFQQGENEECVRA